MRGLAFAALAALLLTFPVAVSAQGPATVRGAVYFCGDRKPVPGARVWLRKLDEGSDVQLVADASGRFVRVGMAPGHYIVTAAREHPRFLGYDSASRLATLENDDVLDMSIGIGRLTVIAVDFSYRADPNRPHPVCDPPVVPPAIPTSDRYIIH